MAESFKMHVFSSLLVQLCNYHIKRTIHVHCTGIRIDKIKSSINIHVVNQYRTSSSSLMYHIYQSKQHELRAVTKI